MRRTRNVCVWILMVVVLAMVPGPGPQSVRAAAQDDEGPWRQIHQNTARSFVIVSYHLKKSDRPYMNGGEGPDYGQRTVLQRILNKNTLDTIGVILSGPGEVFTFERDPVYREVVERITVRGADGVVVPARADRLLTRAPGRIVRIEGGLPAGWQPLQFVECGDITPATRLYVAAMRPERQYHLYVKPCEYGARWDSTDDCGPCLQTSGVYCAGVLCDADGRPVGVTCRDQIDLGAGGPAWRGKEVLADAGLSEEQQRRIEDKIKQDFSASLYEIRIMPRLEPQEDEDYDFGPRYRPGMRWPGGGDGRELLVYGLGFADNKLLIPEALPKEMVAGIDTIMVKVEGEDRPARFGGVLRQCAATVIELQGDKLPRTTAFGPAGKIARVAPFWAVHAHELAGMDVRIECSRWIDKEQGYADQWYPVPERPVAAGSWLLDSAGHLVGLMAEARHEHDRLEPYLLTRDQDRYRSYVSYGASYTPWMPRSMGPGRLYGYGTDLRLFEAAEMAAILADLPAGYDPHVRHLDKDEQKRRLWLGVEYTAPDKEMIKQMGLREPTQDGRIGLMVNRVYPDSPAAQLGLAEGDVLLTLTVPDAPWPIELTAGDREDYAVPDLDEVDIPKEFEAMGLQMPRRRPWPSRDNYLTRLLGDIGAGATVKLGFIHNGELQEKEFTIQQAPRDMLSAAKYKNDKLGLTVKDLTYEVRAALRLKPDEPAVVVTRVEQGTPAALARINTFELIRAVDGTPIESVVVLEKLIAQAQEAGKESVRLTVEWMGKTRLADLKFEAKAPPGFLNSLLQER